MSPPTAGTIPLNSLGTGSGYTLATSGNIQQITLADGYVYTVTGTSNGVVPPSENSPTNSIVFYMAVGATVEFNFSSCTFNCPVTFNTIYNGESLVGGSGRTLHMYGTATFNYHTVINTYGSNNVHTSVVNLGTNGSALTMNLYNFDNNSGYDILKIAGLGYVNINNNATIINCNLNPITAGIHQYSPSGSTNFVLNAGIIYAIVGEIFQYQENLQLTTYMVMDPQYSVFFNYALNIEIGIPSNIPIIVAVPGVEFTESSFNNFAVTVNNGASLLLDGCTFTSSGSNAITANLIGSGTLTVDGSNVITVSPGYGIMSLTGSGSNVSVTGNPTVNIPPGYSYNEPTDAFQASNFTASDSGNYTFGTFGVPLDFTLTGSSLTANVSITAQE